MYLVFSCCIQKRCNLCRPMLSHCTDNIWISSSSFSMFFFTAYCVLVLGLTLILLKREKISYRISHFISHITTISKRRCSMLFSTVSEFYKTLFFKSSLSILYELQFASRTIWLHIRTTKQNLKNEKGAPSQYVKYKFGILTNNRICNFCFMLY